MPFSVAITTSQTVLLPFLKIFFFTWNKHLSVENPTQSFLLLVQHSLVHSGTGPQTKKLRVHTTWEGRWLSVWFPLTEVEVDDLC